MFNLFANASSHSMTFQGNLIENGANAGPAELLFMLCVAVVVVTVGKFMIG